MGSECKICIHFSKKFPGEAHLPHPPPAALRADLATPPPPPGQWTLWIRHWFELLLQSIFISYISDLTPPSRLKIGIKWIWDPVTPIPWSCTLAEEEQYNIYPVNVTGKPLYLFKGVFFWDSRVDSSDSSSSQTRKVLTRVGLGSISIPALHRAGVHHSGPLVLTAIAAKALGKWTAGSEWGFTRELTCRYRRSISSIIWEIYHKKN